MNLESSGAELRMRLTVANQSDAPLHFEEALHTYLAVGDATQVEIRGLANTEFLDKTDGFQRKCQSEEVLTLNLRKPTVLISTLRRPSMRWTTQSFRLPHRTVAKANSLTTVVGGTRGPQSAQSCRTWARMAGATCMTCIETAAGNRCWRTQSRCRSRRKPTPWNRISASRSCNLLRLRKDGVVLGPKVLHITAWVEANTASVLCSRLAKAQVSWQKMM